MKKKILYIADDGNEFDNEEACENYEKQEKFVNILVPLLEKQQGSAGAARTIAYSMYDNLKLLRDAYEYPTLFENSVKKLLGLAPSRCEKCYTETNNNVLVDDRYICEGCRNERTTENN